MSISKSIIEGLKFSFSTKRIVPFLILNLVLIYIFIDFFEPFSSSMLNLENLGSFIKPLGIYIIFFIIMWLAKLWISGALIDQAQYFSKKRNLSKSFKISKSKFLSMFCALIIFFLISTLISTPKFIGVLLGILFSLMFFYIYPVIIIDNKSCIDSFRQSWKVFKKYPLETFVTGLLINLIGAIILIIFLLPSIFYFAGSLVDIIQASEMVGLNETMGESMVREAMIPAIRNNLRSLNFLPYLFIACLGLSIKDVFSTGAKTRLYMNLRRKRI